VLGFVEGGVPVWPFDPKDESDPVPTLAFPEDLPRLRDRWQSWYVKQDAHAQMASRAGRLDRFLLVAVVILSTVVGSSFIASIGENPPTWLKLGLGVLGLVAAVLAALKEQIPFAADSKQHADAEAGFEDLRYEAEELAQERRGKCIAHDAANVRLHELEDEAEKLDKKAPPVSRRRIRKSVRSIERTRRARNRLNKVLVRD
jgi:SMODS and SLOG-associating 2TM effector domain family 4